jgi:hypothetical protein
VEDVLAAQDRVARNATEEVFQESLARSNSRGVLLGL